MAMSRTTSQRRKQPPLISVYHLVYKVMAGWATTPTEGEAKKRAAMSDVMYGVQTNQDLFGTSIVSGQRR